MNARTVRLRLAIRRLAARQGRGYFFSTYQ